MDEGIHGAGGARRRCGVASVRRVRFRGGAPGASLRGGAGEVPVLPRERRHREGVGDRDGEGGDGAGRRGRGGEGGGEEGKDKEVGGQEVGRLVSGGGCGGGDAGGAEVRGGGGGGEAADGVGGGEVVEAANPGQGVGRQPEDNSHPLPDVGWPQMNGWASQLSRFARL